MKIAIYGKSIQESDSSAIETLLQTIKSIGASITFHENFLNAIKKIDLDLSEGYESFESNEDIHGKVDFLISIGGDGTFLDTIALVRASNIPILGINTGRLGFLSTTSTTDIKSAIEALRDNQFKVEKRSLLELIESENLFGDNNYALNEISLLKKDTSSMISVEVEVDGIKLNTYWTDGLIISTATGSTAYSLSCGGPILMPGSGNFVLTPIAPHNLNARPIVINDNSVLKIKIEGRAESNLVSVDSRSAQINNGAVISLRRAKHQISIIQFQEDSFIQSLKNKLNWGLDKRNI